MACVLNLFVISLTLLTTITAGSRQFDVLDKKINAVEEMMEMKIEMIKQDLAMVVKNLSMSVIGEKQEKDGNVNTRKIAYNVDENPKNNNQAAEDLYKVIHRGFGSEKMSLRKNILEILGQLNASAADVSRIDGALSSHANSLSRIEQTLKHMQDQLEKFNGELTSLRRNFMTNVIDLKKDLAGILGTVMKTSETQAQVELLTAEINKNKNDIEAKVEKAKNDAILKSNEDCKTSNIKFNGEFNSLQTNFMKIVNDVKEDVADINRRVMNKSEALAKFQLLNTEVNRNKNDIEAKVDKAKKDAILKSNEEINRNKNDLQAKVEKAKQEAILESNEYCKISIMNFASLTPHKYDNSIYVKLNGTMTYDEGSRRCEQYGAHLPEVTTSEENAFLVRTFAAASNARIFLGATDQLTEGHWVWGYSREAVKFQDWYEGEPNDSGGEDCLEIFRSSWNDIKC